MIAPFPVQRYVIYELAKAEVCHPETDCQDLTTEMSLPNLGVLILEDRWNASLEQGGG